MDRSGDFLIERILAGDLDTAPNKLIGEFYRGYPVEKLDQLLRSESDQVAGVGAWIASELGGNASALGTNVLDLLDHRSREVRFYILDVAIGAFAGDGEALARAISLIRDPDEAVRWKILRLLSVVAIDQLRASLKYSDDAEAKKLIEWLVESGEYAEQDIIGQIDSDSYLARMFGVAAAARRLKQSVGPIEHASHSPDQEVRSFAEGELRRWRLV